MNLALKSSNNNSNPNPATHGGYKKTKKIYKKQKGKKSVRNNKTKSIKHKRQK